MWQQHRNHNSDTDTTAVRTLARNSDDSHADSPKSETQQCTHSSGKHTQLADVVMSCMSHD